MASSNETTNLRLDQRKRTERSVTSSSRQPLQPSRRNIQFKETTPFMSKTAVASSMAKIGGDDDMSFSTTDSSSHTRRAGSSSLFSRARRRLRDEGSSQSSVATGSYESVKVSVRGAGTSAWAVQDAGTYQMLHDECSYLCSAVLMSRSPSQAIEAAIDLGILLSSRNTRSVLWQGGEQQRQQLVRRRDDAARNVEFEAGDENTQSTVFQSVLDVLGKASRPRKQKDPSNSAPTSPTRMRTKSARKRIKQSAPSVAGGPNQACLSNEMKQVLASIVYFLSYDCTMCDKNSVAAMGVVKSSRLARKLRTGLLEHGDAMRAILNLMSSSSSEEQSSSSSIVSSSKSTSASSPATSTSRTKRCVSGTVASSRSSRFSPVQRPLSSVGEDSLSYVGTVSSVSFQEDDLKPPPPPRGDPTANGRRGRKQRKLMMQSTLETATTLNNEHDMGQEDDLHCDPTAAGRRGRKQRKLIRSSLETAATTNNNEGDDLDCDPPTGGGRLGRRPSKLETAAAANNDDGNQEEDDLDWPGNKVIPQKRTKKPKDETLSFASSKTSDNFSKPKTPPRKRRSRLLASPNGLVASTSNPSDHKNNKDESSVSISSPRKRRQQAIEEPKSPDESITSSIGSVTSSAPIMSTRTSQKLAKLLSKVCSPGAEKACSQHETPLDYDVPWVSIICLESFNRIVTGKEEDSPSCLESDENSDEEEEMTEHDNPIVITNMLLGKSQVVPLLGKVMSRSLQAVGRLLEHPTDCQDCWSHWEDRISILSSLIDGACLFHKSNRNAFCESDPFSFDERNGGLVFHIVAFLRQCSKRLMARKSTQKLSSILLLALRTLVSLSHENETAAEQMDLCYPFMEEEFSDGTIRGVDVVADLVYALEHDKKQESPLAKKNCHDDESLHRFDCTVCCLNTLSNIIEAGGVRRTLAEITVVKQSPKTKTTKEISWLKWLCKWLLTQTASFQNEILGVGKSKSSNKDKSSSSYNGEELQKSEGDRLVASGHCCVLLACMMKEPEEIAEEPESTNAIRQLIIDQLPRKEGGSVAYMMIINTLNAFCNFYRYSLGELSVAVVAPVRKLIGELQELEKQEHKRTRRAA